MILALACASLLAGGIRAAVVEGPAAPIAPIAPTLPVLPTAEIPALPPYLTVADPAHAAWVAEGLEAARQSPTALAVLAQVQEAVAARGGRPVLIDLNKVKEAGTYDFDWELLTANPNSGRPVHARVPLLIHELQHFLQFERNLPSDILEIELEAYAVDMRIADELGHRPERGTFDSRARRNLKKGAVPFAKWLNKEYKDNRRLSGKRFAVYERELRAQYAKNEKAIENLEARRRHNLKVVGKMAELGHTQAQLDGYRLDQIQPVERKLAMKRKEQDWIDRDLGLIATPEGRERVRAYVHGVMKKLRDLRRDFGWA